MIKLVYSTFKSSNKSNFLKKIFIISFFTCAKLFKHIHQLNINMIEKKERLQKKLVKNIKVFSRNKKEKSNNMVRIDTKIHQKMKNKSWLSIAKNITN